MIKIINPVGSYAGNQIINYSATVQFYAPDGITLLHERGVSVSKSLRSPGWQTEIKAAFIAMVADAAEALQRTLAAVTSAYPAATTPDEAAQMLAAELETELNGGA